MTTPKPPPAAPDRPVVRVVHPCGAIKGHLSALEAGMAALESAGCEVRWAADRARSDWRGYLAGDDAARSRELVRALTEPGVDIVWFARGGSGGGRIAGDILRAARRAPPRIVIGFSDATSILNVLADRLGWVTFHGPVVTSLGRDQPKSDLEEVLGVLRGELEELAFDPRPDGAVRYGAGVAGYTPTRGRLRGGNLTVLASMAGTDSALTPWYDAVWFLEDVGEAPYRLDRAFWQLRSSGVLSGANGLWLGNFDTQGAALDGIVRMFLEDAAIEVGFGAPAGHAGVISALPIGGEVEIDWSQGTMSAHSPWVTRDAT